MTNTWADSAIRTKGSLCSGTGALDDATPGDLQWVSETNEDASAVLKREHPEVPNLGDLTTYNWSALEHVDLLTSGDPCQSMSAAGRQMASADERFLWPHVMDAIRAVRPKEIFLENVQNIASVPLVKGGERGSVLKMRLDDLRAAGYAVRWTVLGACAVGAPHHRHRWFLRARYVGSDAPAAERVINKCGAPRTGGRLLLPTPRARDWKGGSTSVRPIDGGPDLPTAVSLLPTPTTADGSGGAGKSANGHAGFNLRTAVAILPTPNARDGGDRGTPSVEHAQRRVDNPERSINLEDAVVAYLLPTVREHWGKFANAVSLWEQVTGREPPIPTVLAPKGGRRLNPELSEWMMGLRLGHVTANMPRNAALRLAGNGVVELQARVAWDILG